MAVKRSSRIWAALAGVALAVGVVAPLTAQAATAATPKLTAVALGQHHTIGLTSQGEVYSWGANNLGQAGQGQAGATALRTPKRVVFPDQAGPIKRIEAGQDYTLAFDDKGQLWAWGANDRGQLGTGEASPHQAAPQLVSLPDGLKVADFAAGAEHALLISQDKAVYAWGRGDLRQLGQGGFGTADQPKPKPVLVNQPPRGDPVYLADAVAVAAGTDHSLALLADGGLVGWGDSSRGQLGRVGGYANVAAPVWCGSGACAGLGKIARPLAGDGTTFLIWGDGPKVGQISAFGDNAEGQLGTGSPNSVDVSHTFLTLSGAVLDGVVELSARSGNAIARTATGGVITWGRNDHGQTAQSSATATPKLPALAALTGPDGAAAVAAGHGRSFVIANGHDHPVCLEVTAGLCLSDGWARPEAGGLYGIGDGEHGELGALHVTAAVTDAFVNITLEPGTVTMTWPKGQDLKAGTVLTADVDGWPSDVVFDYVWLRSDGSPVAGSPANQPNYKVVAYDQGQTIIVRVTPQNVVPGDVNWLDADLASQADPPLTVPGQRPTDPTDPPTTDTPGPSTSPPGPSTSPPGPSGSPTGPSAGPTGPSNGPTGPAVPAAGVRVIFDGPAVVVVGETINLRAEGEDAAGHPVDLTAQTTFASSVEQDVVAGAAFRAAEAGLRTITATWRVAPDRTVTSSPKRVIAFLDGPQIVQMPSLSSWRPVVGQTLTTSPGQWQPAAAEVAYQWLRDAAPILGATAQDYRVDPADLGKRLSVRVIASAGGQFGPGRVDSDQTDPVAPAVAQSANAASTPLSLSRLGISGTCAVGRQVVLSGTAAGTAWTLSYQWRRDGAAISRGLGSTYTIKAADAGHLLTVQVAAKRSGQSAVTEVSAPCLVAKIKPVVTIKKAKTKRPAVIVRVKAAGVTKATGTVTVKFGKKVVTVKLKAKHKSKRTVRLPASITKAKVKVKATYLGSTQLTKAKAKPIRLKVR